MIRRMRLVADDELDRLRDRQLLTYEPNIRAANKLDDEIRTLLEEDAKGSPDEMLRTLQAKQARLKMLLSAAKEAGAPPAPAPPPPPVPAPAPVPVPAPVHVRATVNRSTLLTDVPRRLREKARKAIEEMNDNGITFNSDRQLVINGEVVEGSNARDLIHAMNSTTLKSLPPHSSELISALHDIKFPLHLIINPLLRTQYQSHQSGKGYVAPASLLLKSNVTRRGNVTRKRTGKITRRRSGKITRKRTGKITRKRTAKVTRKNSTRTAKVSRKRTKLSSPNLSAKRIFMRLYP